MKNNFISSFLNSLVKGIVCNPPKLLCGKRQESIDSLHWEKSYKVELVERRGMNSVFRLWPGLFMALRQMISWIKVEVQTKLSAAA